jgi:hypothetical protein
MAKYMRWRRACMRLGLPTHHAWLTDNRASPLRVTKPAFPIGIRARHRLSHACDGEIMAYK